MFDTLEVTNCLKTSIGWKNHYDLTEIPALDPSLNVSDSGIFYGSLHPALRLDIIKATLPPNNDLDTYLAGKIEDGIVQLMNRLVVEKGLKEYSKEVLANDVILDRYGWSKDTIMNEGRFVGFQFKMNLEIGLQLIMKNIGFQFNMPQTALKIYVFHSTKFDPVIKFDLTTTTGIEWAWVQEEVNLVTDTLDISGGVWIIGYYQDDIAGEAINYTDFDWRTGPCGTCSHHSRRRMDYWRELHRFMDIMPIFVPAASFIVGEMFDLRDSFNDFRTNWGMNFRLSAQCELSYFFCTHKHSFIQALGLQVTWSILNDMKFRQQINYVEEGIKNMIIRDLEGDRDTNAINIVEQLKDAIKAIQFEHSKKSIHCLPCNNKKGVNYGVA